MFIASRFCASVVGFANKNGSVLSTERDPSQSRAAARAFAEIMQSKVVQSCAPRSDRVSTRSLPPPDSPTNEDTACAVLGVTDDLEHEYGDGT